MGIQAKKKICSGCHDEKYIWKNHEGGKYCQQCWNYIKFKKDPPVPKKNKPIAPKSKKQQKLDVLYTQLRKVYMTNNPMCHAALPGCGQQSTDVHHKKGRGKWYLVVNTWMSVCRHCHTWIETHPIEATEMGFRESKTRD